MAKSYRLSDSLVPAATTWMMEAISTMVEGRVLTRLHGQWSRRQLVVCGDFEPLGGQMSEQRHGYTAEADGVRAKRVTGDPGWRWRQLGSDLGKAGANGRGCFFNARKRGRSFASRVRLLSWHPRSSTGSSNDVALVMVPGLRRLVAKLSPRAPEASTHRPRPAPQLGRPTAAHPPASAPLWRLLLRRRTGELSVQMLSTRMARHSLGHALFGQCAQLLDHRRPGCYWNSRAPAKPLPSHTASTSSEPQPNPICASRRRKQTERSSDSNMLKQC